MTYLHGVASPYAPDSPIKSYVVIAGHLLTTFENDGTHTGALADTKGVWWVNGVQATTDIEEAHQRGREWQQKANGPKGPA